MPFSPPEFRIDLVQYEHDRFRLADGFSFTYTDPEFTDASGQPESWLVDQAGIGDKGTDLASVPVLLWWYVGSYGRHTRAALLHDVLVRKPKTEIPRARADRVFLHALTEEKVPLIRRSLMWTAVSLETSFLSLPGKRVPGGVKRAIGGALVGLHLSLVVGALWFWLGGNSSIGGRIPGDDWISALVVLASWLLVWQARSLSIPVGLVLVAPAVASVWWFKRTSGLLEAPLTLVANVLTGRWEAPSGEYGPTRVPPD